MGKNVQGARSIVNDVAWPREPVGVFLQTAWAERAVCVYMATYFPSHRVKVILEGRLH